MPFPNVHGCRLQNPDDFEQSTFRTMHRDHEGKDYSVIVGKKKGGDAMEEQSYRYEKSIWTAESARTHCEDHGGSFIAAGEGDNAMYPNREILNFSHNSTVADNEPGWASVDKTALPRAAFADQGDPEQKSTWGYPHHWISGGSTKDDNGVWTNGTMYLHEGGLNAAWAAAQGARSGQEAAAAVKAHLQAHRTALGLDEEQDAFRGFEIKALAPTEAEIWLYDEIGSGWFGGVSAKDFADQMIKLGKMNKITVRINSPGGDVFDGIAIYNILKQNPAHVVMNIDGLAASIASVIAMAGDEIYMADNAIMMIHEAWTMGMGNAGDFREIADRLDKVNGSIMGTYAKKTKMDQQKIADMMAAETWMTAQEAMDMGFIDAIGEPLQMAAHFDMSKFNFKKMPTVARVPMQPEAAEDNPVPMPPDLSCFDQGISRCEAILNKG